MRVAIHQPQFLPWLGYFDKLERADLFVFLDDVQFKKNEWQNRNRIRTAQGWQWITVPVEHKFPQKINEVRINNRTNWRKKHLHALEINYVKSPYFHVLYPMFKGYYNHKWETLSVFNIFLIKQIIEFLGIRTEVLLSSSLGIQSTATRRLVEICLAVGGDTYLSGDGAHGYLEERLFPREGISLEYQKFRAPVYRQVYENFEPNLSIVDLLFNCGRDSINIIRNMENLKAKRSNL